MSIRMVSGRPVRLFKPTPSFHAPDLPTWRRWLEAHHASDRIVWLIFDKRATGGRCISYGDALDEALCWGWIDSIVRRIDDVSYARKFTRRTSASKWSSTNIGRMKRLLAEGRVQPAGRAAVSEHVMQEILGRGRERKPARMITSAPEELERALARNPRARTFFESLAPSYRRNYVRWVAEAKQAKTRERRAREAARLLAEGRKVLLK
jgi:uncharacterized protein YdeI (YjbR/CyaY-like superfamily)